ncbi:DUF4913 domain-containing protein [Nocardia puris]|uniref:DUF4913 domain-containing protein n=1 Tax=Nocardia puris TaxID=208602 RepID=UPI001892FD3E|nr:DUF4913 domain-containing protein [Nocardia puris]MBF6212177.1 DUF4913 domain-containing protein [Nocardia puris]
MPPQFGHFTDFAATWMLPTISVRLAEANRENTYTWCSRWWTHRPVAVRVAHLHTAFEAMRRAKAGSSLSTFLLTHLDPHINHILDAANGPLHRCTRTHHQATPSLPFDPLPPSWFGTTTPATVDDKPAKKFGHYSEFVQQWLLPVISVKIAANNREGQYTWCRQWWRHQSVAIRFAGLHACFEAAINAEDKQAMSALFIRHIDPHFRYILDAANGPLHRCTPDQHIDSPGLAGEPVPANWFGTRGSSTPVHRLGFGPDFRAFHVGGERP